MRRFLNLLHACLQKPRDTGVGLSALNFRKTIATTFKSWEKSHADFILYAQIIYGSAVYINEYTIVACAIIVKNYFLRLKCVMPVFFSPALSHKRQLPIVPQVQKQDSCK